MHFLGTILHYHVAYAVYGPEDSDLDKFWDECTMVGDEMIFVTPNFRLISVGEDPPPPKLEIWGSQKELLDD